jgi:hypothetical protein
MDTREEHAYQGKVLSIPGTLPGSPGSLVVDNPARANRPVPAAGSPCALCAVLEAEARRERFHAALFGHDLYAAWATRNPIVAGQVMVVPAGDFGCCFAPEHREYLSRKDVLFMLRAVGAGLSVPAGTFGPREALVYMNAMAGSGRSEPHTHFHIMRQAAVPCLEFVPGPVVCAAEGGCRLHGVAGIGFNALCLEGPADEARAAFAEELHRFFAGRGTPYNLVVVPAEQEMIRIVIIPRGQEYSAAVDQRIGGPELLAGGVFLPGPKVRPEQVTVAVRDQALADATLSDAAWEGLLRDLQSRIGGPGVVDAAIVIDG